MVSDFPVTILYYDEDDPLILKDRLFDHLEMGKDRVLIPDEFRQGRTIIAVLKGKVCVLNTVRERNVI